MLYYKINGNGNNFLAMDNRTLKLSTEELIHRAATDCNVKIAIGADGTLVIENSEKADFKMRIFNSDGSEGEMCGNGARCMAQFAYDIGVAPADMTFETIAGIIHAIVADGQVSLDISTIDMSSIILDREMVCNGKKIIYSFITLGVPHAVVYCKENDIKTKNDMVEIGRAMDTDHKEFLNGTNINFVTIHDAHNIDVTTYERGVNDLTDSCGTGSSASAVISAIKGKAISPVVVQNPGGINTVTFSLDSSKKTCEVNLKGKVDYCAKIQMQTSI